MKVRLPINTKRQTINTKRQIINTKRQAFLNLASNNRIQAKFLYKYI